MVRPGAVQVQSAGSGIVHREVAAPGAGPTRFVQAWLTPDETGGSPSYDLATVTLPDGELVPVASGTARAQRSGWASPRRPSGWPGCPPAAS